MHLSLALHLSIHFILACLAGFLAGRYFGKIRLGVIAGILGGFFIDLDHVLEYFFAFGPSLDLVHFFQGRQFLASGKMFLVFHAWEYIPLLLLLAWIFRRRRNAFVFILSLTFAGTVHLAADCIFNSYPVRNYSIIYRASQGFENSRLLSPAQQELNATYKRDLGI